VGDLQFAGRKAVDEAYVDVGGQNLTRFLGISPQMLTSPLLLGTVRGFREYPEPAVRKRLLAVGERFYAHAILDTRDVPQGFSG